MVSPFVFFPDERLSLAELTAACLDGVLVAIGGGYMPADAAETAWMRACSLRPLAETRLALVRRSAAWVHGGIAVEPARHHVQRAVGRRVRVSPDARVIYHDTVLESADTVVIAGVRVADPVRTLVDLARLGDDAAARVWARADPALARRAAAWVDRHPRLPYGRRALAVLEGATRDEAVRRPMTT